MKNIAVVAFDIADQSFSTYTLEEWKDAVGQWRDELQQDLNEGDFDACQLGEVYHWSEQEVVEAVNGDEFFWDYVSTNA